MGAGAASDFVVCVCNKVCVAHRSSFVCIVVGTFAFDEEAECVRVGEIREERYDM